MRDNVVRGRAFNLSDATSGNTREASTSVLGKDSSYIIKLYSKIYNVEHTRSISSVCPKLRLPSVGGGGYKVNDLS